MAAVLSVVLGASALAGHSTALAQAGGSIGGNIGGSTGGSIGGNIGEPKAPPAPRAAPAARPAPRVQTPVVVQRQPRAPRYERGTRRTGGEERGEGRGSGAFDGTWSLSTASSCAGSGSGAFRVSGSRLSASNARGSVSAAGAVYSTERFNGMTSVYTGRLSGNSGAGSYRRADGCTGNWSASR